MSALLFAPALAPRAQAQSTPRTFAGIVSLDFWKGTYQNIATHETLTFVLADRDSPRYITKTIPYASDGSFSFTIPQGNYDVAIKANRFLQSAGTADLRSGDLTTFALTLEPGDVDLDDGTGHFSGNNSDDVNDLFAVLVAFNTNVNDEAGSYDPNADLDGDGKVDTNDLFALLSNFNVAGAPTPTPTAQWHVANVSLSKTGVVAGQTLTGVVTLASPAPAGGTTVTLSSTTDYFVTFSSTPLFNMTTLTITIPAGATQSAPFTVFTVNTYNDGEFDHTLTDPAYATITASAYGWAQSVPLTVVPNNYSFAIANLDVAPGNGCFLISWKALAEGSVDGYNVYRRVPNGQSMKINSVLWKANFFADTGLTGGQTFQYSIAPVSNGVEMARSAWQSGTASSTGPTLSWVGLPANTTVLNGLIAPVAQVSDANSVDAMFLVDGNIVSSAEDYGLFNGQQVGNLTASLDTRTLANGSHIVQILGFSATSVFATNPFTIQTLNNISSLKTRFDVLDSNDSPGTLSAVLPATTQKWRVNYRDGNGQIVQQWSGTGSIVTMGLDQLVKDLPVEEPLPADGTVDIEQVPEPTDQAEPEPKPQPWKIPGPPPVNIRGRRKLPKQLQALGLMDYLSIQAIYDQTPKGQPPPTNLPAIGSSSDPDTGYVSILNGTFAKFQAQTSLPCAVFTSGEPGHHSTGRLIAINLAIRDMMANTLTTFYMCGHGGVRYGKNTASQNSQLPRTNWGGCLFWPRRPTSSDGFNDHTLTILANQWWNFYINEIVLYPRYNFVWIDACESVGGLPGQELEPWSTRTTAYPDAFKIGQASDGLDGFMGWSGGVGTNANQNGRRSDMFEWRNRFWEKISQTGATLYTALFYANSTPGLSNLVNTRITPRLEVSNTYVFLP